MLFRLFKLAGYSMVAFVLYNVYLGISNASRQVKEEKRLRRTGDLTGEGQGERVQTEEASGESASHIIGRGVTL